jgi:hypothetical protein
MRFSRGFLRVLNVPWIKLLVLLVGYIRRKNEENRRLSGNVHGQNRKSTLYGGWVIRVFASEEWGRMKRVPSLDPLPPRWYRSAPDCALIGEPETWSRICR